MDKFRIAGEMYMGIGGRKCTCCNRYRTDKGKRKGLNKLARKTLKNELDNEVRQNGEF